MRVRIPSVTTSMRVSRLTRVSSRVRKPTVLPTGSPSSCAMRAATARAAMRRGSSIRIFRSPSHALSEQGERDDGALAGAWRSLQQHAAALCQRLLQPRQGLVDRKSGQVGRVMAAIRYLRAAVRAATVPAALLHDRMIARRACSSVG